MKIYCIPYAGAGATVYRSLIDQLEAGQRLVPIQLKGREERFYEGQYASMEEIVDDVISQMELHDQELTVMGHSFGAIVGYEVVKALESQGVYVKRLLVSGSLAPDQELNRPKTDSLSDDAFIAQIESIAGFSHPALANRALADFILPALRSDIRIHESYGQKEVRAVVADIRAIVGHSDKFVSKACLSKWARFSTGRFEALEVQGGHMYFSDAPCELNKLFQ